MRFAFALLFACVPASASLLFTEAKSPDEGGSTFPPIGQISAAAAWISTAAISDANVERRAAAVVRLGRQGAVQPVEWALRSDPHWWVRYAAAGALAKAAGCAALEPLERTAMVDSTWQVRVRAIQALGEFRSPRAVPALSAGLKDSDDGARASAILALTETGGSESLAVLRRALRKETDPFHRRLLSKAVERVVGEAAPAPRGCLQVEGRFVKR